MQQFRTSSTLGNWGTEGREELNASSIVGSSRLKLKMQTFSCPLPFHQIALVTNESKLLIYANVIMIYQ